MANRIAGTAFVVYDGNQLALKGGFTVSPSAVERAMIAGQDYVHGYSEMPRVPFIEGDISTLATTSCETLLAITNSTVQANLANGTSYVLTQAVCRGAFEINTREGQLRIRFEGVTCQEMMGNAGTLGA